MSALRHILKQTVTYKLFKEIFANLIDFMEVMGNITTCGVEFFKALFRGELDKKELIIQCERFGVSSMKLPYSFMLRTIPCTVSPTWK